MNRTLLFTTAAGMLSVALVGSGCQHDESSKASTSSSSSSSMSSNTRTSANESTSVQASGTTGTGAKYGTGTTSAGAQPSVAASANTSAATPGETASAAGQGPAGIDQQNVQDAAAAARSGYPNDRTSQAGAAAAAGAGATAGAANENANAAASANGAYPSAQPGPSAAGQGQAGATDAAQPAAAADKGADHHAGAVANVKPAAGAKDEQVSGTVTFMPADDGVKVMVDLMGMKPDSKHGFHIHEKGDLSAPDLKSAGPHFDPGMTKHHGGTEGDMRHGGDLGNLTADDKGNVKTEIMVHGISIDGAKDGIVGRSVLVHAKADDLKSQPAGDSGDRIAGGVIEKAKHEKADAGSTNADAARTAADKQPADTTGPQPGAQPSATDQQNTYPNK
jgi:Cu-Zn family superoxide dismutase